jgi:hypothetical protein
MFEQFEIEIAAECGRNPTVRPHSSGATRASVSGIYDPSPEWRSDFGSFERKLRLPPDLYRRLVLAQTEVRITVGMLPSFNNLTGRMLEVALNDQDAGTGEGLVLPPLVRGSPRVEKAIRIPAFIHSRISDATMAARASTGQAISANTIICALLASALDRLRFS